MIDHESWLARMRRVLWEARLDPDDVLLRMRGARPITVRVLDESSPSRRAARCVLVGAGGLVIGLFGVGLLLGGLQGWDHHGSRLGPGMSLLLAVPGPALILLGLAHLVRLVSYRRYRRRGR